MAQLIDWIQNEQIIPPVLVFGWLEYFSKALETQMHEMQLKGIHAMKLDILVAKYKLSKRQKQLLQQLLETNEDFIIQ